MRVNKDKYFNGRIRDGDRELIREKRKKVQTALNLYVELEKSGFMDMAVEKFKKKQPELYKKIMKVDL